MADVAFEASGRTLEEMFVSAANAMTVTQIQDIGQLGIGEKKEFAINADKPDRLLHDFLQELIFLKDAELLLFREYDLKITQSGQGLSLSARLSGEQIDPRKHTLLVDVKAVSWHKFSVEKSDGGWKAIVIIDV